MTVYEIARELGTMLSETPQGRRLADARYIFDGNEEAQRLFFSYREARELFREKAQNGTVTDEDKDTFARQTEEIAGNAVVAELLSAESEFAELEEAVFDIARATAEGEFPSDTSQGCSGNCASCGGCR